jgi:hypothetical protein
LLRLAVQLLRVFVPVTEYVVVTDGLNEMKMLFEPVLQVYVFAPIAVITAGVPSQVTLGPLTVSVGEGVTTSDIVELFTQPLAAVAVTV